MIEGLDRVIPVARFMKSGVTFDATAHIARWNSALFAGHRLPSNFRRQIVAVLVRAGERMPDARTRPTVLLGGERFCPSNGRLSYRSGAE